MTRNPLRRPVARLLALGATVALASSVLLPASTANAETAQQAQAAAARAARAVQLLQPRLRAALAAYTDAVSRLGGSVGNDISAQEMADQADAAVQVATQQQVQRVRALYMNGGEIGLMASVLDAQGPADLVERIGSVDHVLSYDLHAVDAAKVTATAAHQVADTTGHAADTAVVSAEQVQADYVRVQLLLASAQAQLTSLSARARSMRVVQAAQTSINDAGQAVSTAGTQAVKRAKGKGIPADFLALYKAAAPTCPGLDWHVLAAIGQVESGHGRNNGPSSGGAMGPMQFLPGTFRAYAVDGNHDGVANIWNPADSIFTAAHYLCANGAGNPHKLYTAIWHYNHADWYVQMVLRVAASLRIKYP